MRTVRLPVHLPPSDGRQFDVVGLGQNSIDLLVRVPAFPESNSKHPIQELVWLPGGQVASAMVGCARLGLRACYIGRFGDDHLADRGIVSLQSEGVTLATATVPGARSRSAVILVDARTGDRTVLWDRDERLAEHADDVPGDVVAGSRVLLVDCDDIEAATRAAQIARAHGVVTVVDVEAVVPGVEELLTLIDVIITSEGFPERITGESTQDEALAALDARFKPAMVCVTLGPHGSLARVDGELIPTPAFPVTCVDSTGAGDAFRAGFISALIQQGPENTAGLLRHANAVAALACRAHGARDGLPRPAEVDALLAAASRT
jgi:sugar/nucleoside kinase (ribokinase family)